ncbi:MAG: response regulator [Vicinamibacterales bacterium]|nr:response regulator [Vicinamibacterales bacterium]
MPGPREDLARLRGELAETRQALRASDARLAEAGDEFQRVVRLQRAILDTLPAHIALLGPDSRVLSANHAWHAFGQANGLVSPTGCVGDSYLAVCDAAGAEDPEVARIAAGLRAVLDGTQSRFEAEYPCHASTEERWFRLTANRLHADVAEAGAVVMHVDVTERYLAARAATDAARKFESIFLDSPVGICMVEIASERILEANPSLCTIAGLDHDAMVGRSTGDLDLWDPPALRNQLVASLLTGTPVENVEARWRRPDGTSRNVLVSMQLLRPDATGPQVIVTFVSDITERRQLEEQFRQAQKMEAIGILAGGIAHDFNNLLSVIVGYTQLLEEEVPLDDSAAASLTQIQRAADQATGLTRQLLAFSRRQVMQLHILDPGEVVWHMEPMLQRFIGEDIKITVEVRGTPGQVRADRGQLEQVLMNLAANARDAMPTGGVLAITVEDADVDEATAARHPGLQPGSYVRIRVSDVGTGMDAATCARVFEPFFTTKAVGHGTGLGLATVYGIVKQSSGHIRVESQPGLGTRFTIDLPRHHEIPDPLSPAADTSVPAGHETILLVEDEDLLRQLLTTVLQRLGYEVIAAPSGQAALDIVNRTPRPLHLVLTDVVMPGINGRELAEQLLVARPGLRVLFMSGYTEDAVLRHGVSAATVNFIQKPMTPNALAEKVRAVLDQH